MKKEKGRKLRVKDYKQLQYKSFSDSKLKVAKDKLDLECPYCGKRMIPGKGKDVGSRHEENNIYRCPDFPSCDCYCRVDYYNNKIKMISTPANKKLRALRSQAHHYMNILTKNNIETARGVYRMLQFKYSYGTGQIHIGNCHEGACIEIINECISLIYNNKHKLKFFKPWVDRDGQCVLTEESKERIRELSNLHLPREL